MSSEVAVGASSPTLFQGWLTLIRPNFFYQTDSNVPDSTTYWFHLTNLNVVDVTIVPPSGSKVVLGPNKTYGPAYSNGTYSIVAPGTPDVVYFKINYKDYDTISTERGPLNGKFTLTTEMR
ncbi:hypothetical protein CVT26_005618 [Gymnopilus dilepis]|uniref:Uncharacterized protein n=1 Tax=Gymnopilus dilepis TaxID=231916 RepID=A0A409XZL2_9AGAR|nr:hypothetical protein CVT26_005618 [Gymnopilus dilepis]